jgi:hypothetical protein
VATAAEAAFTPHQPGLVPLPFLTGLRAARDIPVVCAAHQSSMLGIFQDPCVALDAAVLSPREGASMCSPRPGHVAASVNAGGTDTCPATLPYLCALLTPSKTLNPVRRRPAPITDVVVCFRCVTPDHLVRDCRDPVRCRNC